MARSAAPPARYALPSLVLPPTTPFAGRLRYDTLANGRAYTLPTWLLIASDRHVAERVAASIDGQLQIGDGSDQESVYRVLSNQAEIDILLDGSQAIRLRMLRRHGSTVLRCCNGSLQRTPFGQQPCECPPTLERRWQAAKAGQGCEPLIHVAFRLTADPTLGSFLFSSATWTFADHAMTVKAVLRRRRDKPICARMVLNRAVHTTGNGTTFAYSRPTIAVLSA